VFWVGSVQQPIHLKTVRVSPSSEPPLDETDNTPGLYANVFRPAGVTERSKLPVVVVSTYIIQNKNVPLMYAMTSDS